jgi:hypothetical protein
MADKRKIARRDFTYYMQVTDDLSKQLMTFIDMHRWVRLIAQNRSSGQGFSDADPTDSRYRR